MRPFWITNVSKHLISIGDLGILLQPHQSVNLLDRKHYSFTEEQIQASITSGSLHKRSDKIFVRKLPPQTIYKGPSKINLEEEGSYPSKIRSLLEHKEFNYEEYQISDDEYAKENADSAEEDDVGKFKKG
jgi:hypothetical protein